MPTREERSRFIGEPIRVGFEKEPLFLKNPSCPSRFEWRGHTFQILEVVAEWRESRRRGRAQEEKEASPLPDVPTQRGSWGVGKTFFQVNTDAGREFVLYYDRAPRNVDDRRGTWLLREEVLRHPQK